MRILQTKVYDFAELNDEAKQKAIDNYYENETYDFLSEDLKQSLNYYAPYWEDVRLYYSLSYCQGDGLSFEGNLDLEKYLSNWKMKKSVKKAILSMLYYVKSKPNNRMYCFCSENDIEFEYQDYAYDEEYPRLTAYFEDKILPFIRRDYYDLCEKLQKEGYAEIDYRMTFEEFEDLANVNDWEYTEDGNLI